MSQCGKGVKMDNKINVKDKLNSSLVNSAVQSGASALRRMNNESPVNAGEMLKLSEGLRNVLAGKPKPEDEAFVRGHGSLGVVDPSAKEH